MEPARQHPSDRDLAALLEAEGRAAPRRRLALLGGGALLVALVAGAFALFGGKGPQGPRFETVAVSTGDLEVTITATGRVQGLNTVEIGAEVSGRLTEVLVDHNARVEAGALLARIDPEQFEAAMEEAAARVASAQASLRQALATSEENELRRRRAEEQSREGLIARQDLEAAQAGAARAAAAVASARADARLAQANLTSARTRLDRTEIRTPIGGVVLARLVEPGQTVTAGFQTPVLFKVAEDLTRMRLHAFVDESDVGRVREGQPARFSVDAWPDRTFEAQVLAVRNEPRVEQNVVTYETLLSVDNAEGLLRPGMTATATIVVDQRKDAVLVPNAALRFAPPVQRVGGPPIVPGLPRGGGNATGPRRPAGPGGPRVWVVEEGTPRPLPVRVLATDGMRSEVAGAGVEPGLQVIVDLAEAR